MKVIGLRIEKYIGKSVSAHNCGFEYSDAEFEKHIIFGVLSDNRKVEIELYHSEGECCSGWTTASWGHINVREVKRFYGYQFKPKDRLEIPDILPGFEGDINNDVFSVSYDGGDGYYPYGGYIVNMELFKATSRVKGKRMVWIFMGSSNSGKSYLSSRLNGLEVYETDSSDTLPEVIIASVVVLGNKYEYTLEDVKSRVFGDSEIQVVNFAD